MSIGTPGFSLLLCLVSLAAGLLGGMLGISEEAVREEKHIEYVRGLDAAYGKVREGAAEIAFLLEPTTIEQVADVAFSGRIRLGCSSASVILPGGLERPCGVRRAALHNCSLGHNDAIYQNPTILQHYLAGLQYVLGDYDVPAIATPPVESAPAK